MSSNMYAYSASSVTNQNLLEQALEQGERLRKSIVQTIVKDNPLYIDISTSTLKSVMSTQSQENQAEDVALSLGDKHKFLAYIKGDPMSAKDEKQVMDTFRSLSTNDICDLTAQSFVVTQSNCKCDTCKAYGKINYNKSKPVEQLQALKLNSKSNAVEIDTKNAFLHYVDSLKIAVHSFKLSDEGKIKVIDASAKKTTTFNELANVSYFIEYELPNCISKTEKKKKSKVDTGLNTNNLIKICSKKIINNVVLFKQISLHDIDLSCVDNDNVDLEDIELKFKVTSRTLRQKQMKPNVIGIGAFNFGEFLRTSTFTTCQELVVLLKEDSPVVTGTLKLQLQLGCDKLYFGKEFLNSLQTDKENRAKSSVENLDETFTLTEPSHSQIVRLPKQIQKFNGKKPPPPGKVTGKPQKIQGNYKTAEVQLNLNNSTYSSVKYKSFEVNGLKLVEEPVRDLNTAESIERPILFGFIFVSEVEYLENKHETYFTCQPFCQNDFVQSNATIGGARPCFNFHQAIPYIYDENFIFKLRDNYMILEFLERDLDYRTETIGICKIPLHQYYLAFRNPTIVKYLERNKLPVIGTDWHEPITDPHTGTITGHVQILVALGSETQIRNLQQERGFMDDIVKKAKSVIAHSKPKAPQQLTKKAPNIYRKSKIEATDASVQHLEVEKVDKSTLVTAKLIVAESMEKTEPTQVDQCSKFDNRLETIQNYLQQLVAMKEQHQNEEPATEPVGVKQTQDATTQSFNDVIEPRATTGKTADLLDTLQSAMTLETVAETTKDTFRVHILVESALHLPARKKCIAKKVKGKVVREKLLPSTYVSYDIKDGAFKTSQVIQKSTSPVWNMKNEVSLPIELLTNKNRRLLFKVWKKCNNGSTIPNMQIDTIIGFATVDLTVLLAGLPTIEGWFNIMDCTNKCNGQIKINVTPLENITKYNKQTPSSTTTTYTTPTSELLTLDAEPSGDTSGETLSRALKRKFFELDEISQRLKSRLNNVTEELNDDSDTIDDIADEFEKDINTLCIEEDYDLLDFAKEAQDLNMERVSSSLNKWKHLGSSSSSTCELMITTDDHQLQMQQENLPPEYALHFAAHEDNDDDVDDSVLRRFVLAAGGKAKVGSDQSSSSSAPVSSLNLDSHTTATASSSLTTLDKQLVEGKERIDHLLQKLTLISKNDSEGLSGFSSRYASGCSTSIGAANAANRNRNASKVEADIWSELGIKDFDASKMFDASLVSFNGNLEDILDLACTSKVRDAPDGEGNTSASSDDK